MEWSFDSDHSFNVLIFVVTDSSAITVSDSFLILRSIFGFRTRNEIKLEIFVIN